MLENLKIEVYEANLALKRHHLSLHGWGNVSGIDRDQRMVVVKPNGLFHDALTPDDMILIGLDGNMVEGRFPASADAPTYLEIYRHFPDVGGICHTHSGNATAWAQACRPIPCLGTTHAHYYHGEIPVTRPLTEAEIMADYERNTGKVIIETFKAVKPEYVPAVLVANHGPFVWGPCPAKAVESALVLEQVAEMALKTALLRPKMPGLAKALLDKHYTRKCGPASLSGS